MRQNDVEQPEPRSLTEDEAIAIAKELVERKHHTTASLGSLREEEKRWVIGFQFDSSPPGRHKGDVILVDKMTAVARSIGLR
jgi:hypothetical protein